MTTLAEAVARRDGLVERLTVGWDKIEAGLAAGQDVTRWETAWLVLLRQYEAADDQVRALRGRADGPLRQVAMRISAGVR